MSRSEKMAGMALAASVLMASLAAFSSAEQLKSEDALDELAFADLQISAVTVDMAKNLGWFPDDKEAMKEAASRAQGDLETLKGRLGNMEVTGELAAVKDAALSTAARLQDVYNGIEGKSDEEMLKGFKICCEEHGRFEELLQKALGSRSRTARPQTSLTPLDEEVKLMTGEGDDAAYRGVIALLGAKRYGDAYASLTILRDRYRGAPAEDCIILRLSDCLLMAGSEMRAGVEGQEGGEELLSHVVAGNTYSPVLYESFLKWRTIMQCNNYGMSNMSEIPNREYNEKRRDLVRVIRRYLRGNPGDIWAREQADLLLELPNIERGGLMGNTNLMHWAGIYAADEE
jgi:hypothetical protein